MTLPSHPDQATASASELTFTVENWNVPQAVTVTAINNADPGTNPEHSVLVGEVVSGDAGSGTHSAVPIVSVQFTNTNED